MRALMGNVLVAAGVAAGYLACTVVGTLLSVPPSGFAIIWPSTAFLIAVMLILPVSRWWTCAAGAVPMHFALAALMPPEAPLVVVATQVAGNLFLAAATVVAVRRIVSPAPRFDSLQPMLTFMLVAGLAVPAVVNVLVLSVHLATGWTSDLWLSWRQWMIAGVFPTVTIPPLAVLAWNGRLTGSSAPKHALAELALLVAVLFAISFLSLGAVAEVTHWPALFLAPFPFLLWAAMRLGVGGTCVVLLALALGAIVQALRDIGPFAAQSAMADVISLQAFLITLSVPLLLLAAVVDDRRREAELRRQSEARLQVAASSTDTGLWQWDMIAERLWLTDNCREMFGLAADGAVTVQAFLRVVHPDDRARVAAVLDDALSHGEPRPAVDFRVRSQGVTRWFVVHTHTELGEHGTPLTVSGVFREVTDRVEARHEADGLRLRILRLQEDERRRIAQELHDSTAQHLVAASLNLFNLQANAGARLQSLIEEAMRSIREAATEIRTFSYLLHPPQLDSEGLVRVLRQYVPGFERRTGIRTTLRITPRADLLSPDQQHAILRIAQESLGNVHRHADAASVSVDVRCVAENVHLIVRDDGVGIPPESGQQIGERLQLGVGIPAMTARVRQLGGRIDVSSRKRGTTVHVAIPLASDIRAEWIEATRGAPMRGRAEARPRRTV